jgi:hypothetical protein
MGRYTIARSAVSILFFYDMNALSVSVVDYLVVVVLARGFQIFGHRALPNSIVWGTRTAQEGPLDSGEESCRRKEQRTQR